MQYFPRLDGIRALAVGGVLVSHFFRSIPFVPEAQLGKIGVRIFFVLSGFLITRILLDYRERMSVAKAARTFYWRRFLRLAPPFYFAIVVALIIDIGGMRTNWPFHALYLSNFLLAVQPGMPLAHLWSLAVEEQFYLAWFVVVVWLPRRWLVPSIVAAIAIAPLFRVFFHGWVAMPQFLPPAVFDCLGLGCLIGVASLHYPKAFNAFADWRLFWISGAAVVALLLFPSEVWFGTAVGIFGASLIALAATPSTNGLDWLCVAPLRDIGKISYGIYLYHSFVWRALLTFGVSIGVLQPLLNIWISIVVAAISWVMIERPAMRLKGQSLMGSAWTAQWSRIQAENRSIGQER